jgi:CRISPR type I-E-associated protein CasB/Cse2
MTDDDAPTGQPCEPPAWLADDTAYIRHLIKVCDTAKGRADLRTGIRPGVVAAPWRMTPYLAKYLREVHPAGRALYLEVAAWYAQCAPRRENGADLPPAWQPGRGNLGWSTGTALKRGALQEVTVVSRLETITRQQDPAVMRRYLWPLVQRLTTKGVPVDWPRLLRDLRRWRLWPLEVTGEWMYAHYDPDHHTLNAAQTDSDANES